MKTHLWSTSFCNSLQMSSSFCCNLFLRCSGGRWEKSSVTVGCNREWEGWLSLKLNHKTERNRHLRRVPVSIFNWQKLSFNLHYAFASNECRAHRAVKWIPKTNTPVKQSLFLFNVCSIKGIIWGAWELFFVQLLKKLPFSYIVI